MEHRFFDPESMIWRVDREMVLLVGGGRALLMQIAHPKVAEGVADHSRFREDPMGRLYQTMNTMWSILFDELPEAQASLQRMKQIHQRVQGTVKHDEVLPTGTPYRAEDPDLLLWVHATLVDSALLTYQLFVGPLTIQEKQQYYDGAKRLGALLGVPEDGMPPSLSAFHAYMDETIDSDTISVGSTASAVAKEILYPGALLLKAAGPLSRLITIGLLPPKLRQGYGLTWNHRREKMLQILTRSVRGFLPFLPEVFRFVPQARSAQGAVIPAPRRFKIPLEKSHH